MPAPKDPKARALWIKRNADARRGRKQTPESNARRSKGMKRAHAEGRAHVLDNTGLRRSATSQWKDDAIGYRGAHSRLNRERGRPSRCEHCDTTIARKFEWALKHDAEVSKAEAAGRFAGMPYSPRPTDYLRLCTACHHEYDGREHGPSGQFL